MLKDVVSVQPQKPFFFSPRNTFVSWPVDYTDVYYVQATEMEALRYLFETFFHFRNHKHKQTYAMESQNIQQTK